MLVDSKSQSLGSVTNVANVIFAQKLINKVTFLINGHTVLKIRWKKCIRFDNNS